MKKDKHSTFKRLANSRVNKALNMIKLVSNLSNKSHYDYTEREIKMIIQALEAEVKNLKHKFSNNQKNKKDSGFNIE